MSSKRGRKEKEGEDQKVKKIFLVAFVVSGVAFVPVQQSNAQIDAGIPGVGAASGVNYGYPHFEYGYYPHKGYYYQQPDFYGGQSYDSHHGRRVYPRDHRYRSEEHTSELQ